MGFVPPQGFAAPHEGNKIGESLVSSSMRSVRIIALVLACGWMVGCSPTPSVTPPTPVAQREQVITQGQVNTPTQPIHPDRQQSSAQVQPSTQPETSRVYPGHCRVLHDYCNPVNMVPDGHPDTIVTFEYEGDLLIREVSIQNNPEAPNETVRRAYTYDAKGRLASATRHRSSAGVLKSQETFRYDNAGHLVERRLDEDIDGTVDWRDEIEYDTQGRRTMFREQINTKTGRAGLNRRYVYDGDRLQYEDVDNDGDGRYSLRIHYTYDDAGQVATKVRDWEMDGQPEETRRFTYDKAGRVIAETIRSGNGENPGHGTISTYDSFGNLVQEIDIIEHNREVTHRRIYDYRCWDE